MLKGGAVALLGGFILQPQIASAEHYLDADDARDIIWGDTEFTARSVDLSRTEMKSIQRTSKTRVRDSRINGFLSSAGDWFILDQVIGKHEFIDIAVGIDRKGQVKGIEILEYRESYGYEIINPKWRAQFRGKDASSVLILDKQIKNISGATLSCRHVTDGINRLTHTWDQVLRHVPDA